jgi:MFS family permease
MAVAAVSLFGFTGIAILTVLFYEKLQGLSALDTGWRILAMFGTYVVVAFGTGRVIRRTGFKGPLTVGLVLGGVASIGLSTIDAGSGFAQMWPWLAVFGAACGLVAAPSTAAALVSVDPARAGMASGAVNTARQVGSVMGASLLGSILAGHITSPRAGQSTGAAFVAGLHTGYLVNAVVFFVTAGVALAFVRNRPHLNSSPSNAAGPGLNMRRSRR